MLPVFKITYNHVPEKKKLYKLEGLVKRIPFQVEIALATCTEHVRTGSIPHHHATSKSHLTRTKAIRWF